MNEQEQLWVEQARAGDKQAFSQLVGAYQRPVYNLTYRMLSNPQEAEDAAQETFLRAYSRLHQYKPSHKFSTWLFSIANHLCIDRLRKRRARFVSIDDNPVLQNLEGKAEAPEQSAMVGEHRDEVQKLIGQLAPEYRTPLILRYWEEYSYDEIADTMDITVSAVKSRLFRARKQLAKLYQQAEAARTPVAVSAASQQTTEHKTFGSSECKSSSYTPSKRNSDYGISRLFPNVFDTAGARV